MNHKSPITIAIHVVNNNENKKIHAALPLCSIQGERTKDGEVEWLAR